jgi:hypothetical protein
MTDPAPNLGLPGGRNHRTHRDAATPAKVGRTPPLIEGGAYQAHHPDERGRGNRDRTLLRHTSTDPL